MSRLPEFYKKNVNGLISLGPIARVTRVSPLNELVMGVVLK